MRGDRPSSNPVINQGHRGYPACAGIDHMVSGCATIRHGLPRMRGDRPLTTSDFEIRDEATPHARGSTARKYAPASLDTGYPACAGIDLLEYVRDLVVEGLPRMRGDRPCHILLLLTGGEATPHARGSTFPAGKKSRIKRGYPACAGIDLGTILGPGWAAGLPRMRGDRPARKRRRRSPRMATPHARGSTRKPAGSPSPCRGYPACAGIDLEQGSPVFLYRRLPRMRGDRP